MEPLSSPHLAPILTTLTLTRHHPTRRGLRQGVFNSVAAGVLIYVSMVEMIAEDFQSTVVSTKPFLKVRQFLVGPQIIDLTSVRPP